MLLYFLVFSFSIFFQIFSIYFQTSTFLAYYLFLSSVYILKKAQIKYSNSYMHFLTRFYVFRIRIFFFFTFTPYIFLVQMHRNKFDKISLLYQIQPTKTLKTFQNTLHKHTHTIIIDAYQ